MQRVLTEDSSSGSSSVTSDIFSSQGTLLSESDPEKILSTLSNKITKDFPPYPQIHTQIKYVQKSMEEYLSPAFYMIPAIDNTSENVIYINKGHITFLSSPPSPMKATPDIYTRMSITQAFIQIQSAVY